MVAAVRTFITLLVIIAVIVGATAIFLYATSPDETGVIRFPLSKRDRGVIASVPASAEVFAYLPRAAALEGKLRRNPVARDLIASWTANRRLPRPWMLGGADLVMWQSGGRTRYLLRLDPVRAMLVRVYLMAGGDSGDTILINAMQGRTLGQDDVARIEGLAAKLPPGDAFVVQRAAARGSFPPLARPTVSSVSVTDSEIVITSRANAPQPASGHPLPAGRGEGTLSAQFARTAILSATFASPPRVLQDLNRLLGTKVSTLLSDGGSIALYDVDTGKLLPRPLGVLVVKASEDRREAIKPLSQVGGRVVERPDELVVAFDDSIDVYLKDAVDRIEVPGGQWAVRIDAQRLAPILARLKDHVGLRIASNRLFRSARSLHGWIGSLEQAKMIEASDSFDGAEEELKVRVTAK